MSPKKSRTAKPSPKKSTTKPADAEPEVLNAESMADSPPQTPKELKAAAKQREREKLLDPMAAWLAEQPQPVPVKIAAVTVYGGAWTPDREISVLRTLKEDGRFLIESKDHTNWVSLAGAGQTTLADVQALVDQAEAEPPAQTLGDLVEAAKGQQQTIPWPHGIGSSVLLLTEGYPPKKAVIRNMNSQGGYTLYDLNIEGGRGTVDGVPASRIGRDLDADGEVAQLRAHVAVLERHRARGRELAQRHIAMQAEEKDLAEALSEHRKSMAEVAKKLAEHARAEPGQTDLLDVVGGGDAGPSRGEKMASDPSDAEDKLAGPPPVKPGTVLTQIESRIRAGDVLDCAELGVTNAQLQAAALNQATASTGKPQKLEPIDLKGYNGEGFIATDVHNGVAVLLPVLSEKRWTELMLGDYGQPKDLPSDDTPERLARGGKLTGTPVRVGRAVRFIGPEALAVLVKVPCDDPAPKPTGKDAAAGD